MKDLFTESGASFSVDRRYRYTLWREWDSRLPIMNFIMLNPSTADEQTNDPTIERCQRRAVSLCFGSLVVTNLFALRSTDPQGIYTDRDPVGAFNDDHILRWAQRAALVVCAWGIHGRHLGRGHNVASMLQAAGIDLYALRISRQGQPGHPLYLEYSINPTLWRKGCTA